MSLLGKLGNLVPAPVRAAIDSAKETIKAVEGQVQGKDLADTFDNAQYLASQTVKNGFAELKDRLGIALHGTPKGPFPSMVDLQKKFPDAGLPARMIGTNIDDAVMYDPKVDPQKVMAQLEATGMNSVRLGAYWDHIQPSGPGGADFARLDEWLAAAEQHHVKVVLTVGAKAPNWPEYHFPQWARPADAKDVSKDPRFCANVEAFVRLVAEHEKNNSAVCIGRSRTSRSSGSGPITTRSG